MSSQQDSSIDRALLASANNFEFRLCTASHQRSLLIYLPCLYGVNPSSARQSMSKTSEFPCGLLRPTKTIHFNNCVPFFWGRFFKTSTASVSCNLTSTISARCYTQYDRPSFKHRSSCLSTEPTLVKIISCHFRVATCPAPPTQPNRPLLSRLIVSAMFSDLSGNRVQIRPLQ